MSSCVSRRAGIGDAGDETGPLPILSFQTLKMDHFSGLYILILRIVLTDRATLRIACVVKIYVAYCLQM
jgi:hypothetical protein